jgi:hypothetical protein
MAQTFDLYMQTCMKPEGQPSNGLSIAYNSIDRIHIWNLFCQVLKATEFPQSPQENRNFGFFGSH